MAEILEAYDFTQEGGGTEPIIRGSVRKKKEEELDQGGDFPEVDQPQYASSLEAAKGTLAAQLADVQQKMKEIQARREQVGEQRAKQAEQARRQVLGADLLDAANLVGGISSQEGQLARAEAQKKEASLQGEFADLEKQLAELEKAEATGEVAAVDLMSQEEQEQAAAQQAQQEAALAASKKDPESEISQQVRASVELVLGETLPAELSAEQIESVYPELVKQAELEKKQSFEASEGAKERYFKKVEAEKNRAFDLDQQAQKLAAQGKSGKKEIKSNQAIAAGFGRRLQQSQEAFEDLESQGFDRASLASGIASSLPNWLQNSAQQRQAQAERNFVNATLRRESGAAIAESEFESAEKQYFPRAGDSPETLAQKARNRAQVINMMQAEAGPAWDEIALVSIEDGGGEGEGETPSSETESAEKPPRRRFVPGSGVTSGGRKIFKPRG